LSFAFRSCHLSGSRDIWLSPGHQVFERCPLASEQELRCRTVEAGLTQEGNRRAQLAEFASQPQDLQLIRHVSGAVSLGERLWSLASSVED